MKDSSLISSACLFQTLIFAWLHTMVTTVTDSTNNPSMISLSQKINLSKLQRYPNMNLLSFVCTKLPINTIKKPRKQLKL